MKKIYPEFKIESKTGRHIDGRQQIQHQQKCKSRQNDFLKFQFQNSNFRGGNLCTILIPTLSERSSTKKDSFTSAKV